MKKQNINKGDRLLCKEDFSGAFKKYKYYYVDNFKKYSTNNIDYFYYIRTETNAVLPFYNEEYFYEFFCTKKEERNIKLTKLNEKTEY